MKKLIVLCALVAFAGFAIAEIPLPNAGFESGMSGWGTWGSGSGSGPLGSAWMRHWAYIDTTGNAHSGQNFLNLTTASQIGYYEYWGYGINEVWRSEPIGIVGCEPGDWFKMGVWAKDIGGYGGSLDLRFEWLDWTGAGAGGGVHDPLFPDEITVYPTTEWAYYSAWVQAPEPAFYVLPVWKANSPGTEIGIDDLEFVPEPMTIALLGLGALALRRRK